MSGEADVTMGIKISTVELPKRPNFGVNLVELCCVLKSTQYCGKCEPFCKPL